MDKKKFWYQIIQPLPVQYEFNIDLAISDLTQQS